MKTLKEQAEEYLLTRDGGNPPRSFENMVEVYEAGANSKWVETEKIRAQIEALKPCTIVPEFDWEFCQIGQKIIQLRKQLKELEDENA